MDETPLYKAVALKSFISKMLQPRFPADFQRHRTRSLLRMYGNVAQMVGLSGGRYATTLGLHPILYVAGACPWVEEISAGVAWDLTDEGKWTFQNVLLDDHLADKIIDQLEGLKQSFFGPMSDTRVREWLNYFCKDGIREHAPLYLGFYLLTLGDSSASIYLQQARKIFKRICPNPDQEWQRQTSSRIELLLERVGSFDGAVECRKEAEEHALKLKLPQISWPSNLEKR